MKKTTKEKIRILKSLARKGSAFCVSQEADKSYCKVLIEELTKQSLVEANNKDGLRITPEGRCYLKRAICTQRDPYAEQHRQTVNMMTTEKQALAINLAESPLVRLYNRRAHNGKRLIDEMQLLAGERLRKDFEAAQLSPKLGISLVPRVDGGKHKNGSALALDGAIAARKRIDAAIGFVGNEMGSVLLDVCCFLKGLECVERERKWPVRSAKVVLGLALRRLAEHYGLSEHAVGANKPNAASPLVWHASD